MIPKNDTDCFAQARQQKRLVFQTHWNRFVQSPLFLSALIVLSIAQGLFTVFSGTFLHEQAVALRVIRQSHPLWCDLIVFVLQLIISAPGCVFAAGLWNIRRKTRWEEGSEPNLSGIKLLRRINYAVCLITGITLALYPTIIVTAGEYLPEKALLRLFYLLLASTALFILCVTLVRIILRTAEDNLSCCWTESRFVILLIVILILIAIGTLVFAPLSKPFYIALAVLAAAFAYLLIVYQIFLHRTSAEQAEIDQKAVSSRENPDDPYLRY